MHSYPDFSVHDLLYAVIKACACEVFSDNRPVPNFAPLGDVKVAIDEIY